MAMLSSGGGGGGSLTSTDDEDDPFSGGSGGKTGSEILAEGGGIESVATIDSSVSSVEEKIQEDGASATASTFTSLAQDGDDSNEATTFDSINNTQQGQQDLQDAAQSLADTARSVANAPDDVPSKAETAAANAAAALRNALPDEFLDANGGLTRKAVTAVVAVGALGVAAIFGGN